MASSKRGLNGHRDTFGRSYKREYYTLVHCYTQNINALGLLKQILFMVYHCKSMGTNDFHFTPRA